MDRDEYERLKKSLKDEYASQLSALETIWKLSNRFPNTEHKEPAIVSETTTAPTGDTQEPSLPVIVWNIIKKFDDKLFTVVAIEEQIKSTAPEMVERFGETLRGRISGTLQRLKAKEYIVQLNGKAGPTPGEYRKK